PARLATADQGERMSTRIAINGFGRIGRGVVRALAERDSDLEIVAINDITDTQTLAHLLSYDSVYGVFPGRVRTRDGSIEIDRRDIRALAERDPAPLPWADLGVDVVIESTGRFRTRAEATKHLDAGARKVVLSAPIKGAEPADANIVLGVNDD